MLKVRTFAFAKRDSYTLRVAKTCLKKMELMIVMNKSTLTVEEMKPLIQLVRTVFRLLTPVKMYAMDLENEYYRNANVKL